MFFIVGCGRSGTTAISKLLQLNKNLDIAIEPLPYFAEENSFLSKGIICNKKIAVENFFKGNGTRKNRIKDPRYGEKHITLGPFIEEIYHQSGAKFIYVYRDGRESIQSFINWDEVLFGSVYRESLETKELSVTAAKAAMSLTMDHDHNDRSRPRSLNKFSDLNNWLKLSRFEMICHMWSEVNKEHFFSLNKLPTKNVFFVNINNLDIKLAKELFLFLEQPCPTISEINNIIESKINSLQDRGSSFSEEQNKEWPNWSQKQRTIFEKIAGPTMKMLGYWNKNLERWKPVSYGSFWKKKTQLENWYEWMFNHRILIHEEFFKFFDKLILKGEKLCSIMDIGCGIGHGYTERYKTIEYIGVHLSANAINLAKSKSKINNQHQFINCDFLKDEISKKADIVMSSGTIDNIYDISLYLKRIVSLANKYIYITCYRGWFPEANEHVYNYVKKDGTFNNIISPSAIFQQLKELGCTDISVKPLWTDYREIPFETEIFAKVPCN
ncbi:Methyltransferase domain containing protein [Candidatus Pelagibacterales bacterium]